MLGAPKKAPAGPGLERDKVGVPKFILVPGWLVQFKDHSYLGDILRQE